MPDPNSNYPEASSQPKNPKHNRMKLVYGDKNYWYVEHTEARRIIKLIEVIKTLEKKQEDGWIPVVKLAKHLKINKSSVIKQLRYLCGIEGVYMYDNGRYKRLAGKLIQVRREMQNPLNNYNPKLSFLTGPSFVRSARL